MMIIAPSILSADFLNLKDEINRLSSARDLWIHLDIMDGHFVPNLTFGKTVIKNLSQITDHPLDAHFMVTNPQAYMDPFKDIKLHNFTFHWEAVTHHDSFISQLKTIYPSVGVSLNPSTPVSVIPEYLFEKIDLILVMTVNPGFGGQKFINDGLTKTKQLNEIKKRTGFDFHIQIDGGVNDTNAKKLADAGATNLVAGSYIFGEPNKDFIARIEQLR